MAKPFILIRDWNFMNEYAYLTSLLTGTWEKIAVQGGLLQRAPLGDAFLLSGLWIFIAERWIEISAQLSINDRYFLVVDPTVLSPIPEPSRLFMPPRKLLESDVADLRLNEFIRFGVSAVSASPLVRADSNVTIFAPLVIESVSGYKIQIAASSKFLGHIELRSLSQLSMVN